jgi:hypothetical protein
MSLDQLISLGWLALVGYAFWYLRAPLHAAVNALPGLAGRVSRIGSVELQQTLGNVGIVERQSDSIDHSLPVNVDGMPAAPDLERIEQRIRVIFPEGAGREARLIRALAFVARTVIARDIFGTQLAVLRTIAASGPLPSAALADLYQEHVRRATAASLPPKILLDWISFLQNHDLLVVDAQGRHAITDIGRAFLEFANSDPNLTNAKAF